MFRRFLPISLIVIVSILVTLSYSEQSTVSAAQETAAWQTAPGPTGGSIAAVAVSPDFSADQTAYAAVRGRGVYRSEDGGFKWQPAGPDGWYVNDLVLSPDFANDETLFVANGLSTVATSVQRSNDGGLTWQAATFAAAVTDGHSLVISPAFASDQTLYLVTGGVPQLSVDGGASFSAAGGWLSTRAVEALAMASDQILFAATSGSGAGIYRTVNGGTNWLPVRSGTFTAVAASPAYAVDSIILALDSSGQLHRSGDGGTSWTTPALTISSGGTETIAFSPTFASDKVVLAAGSLDDGPYISIDSGLTWSESGWYDPADTLNNGLIGGAVFDLAPATNQDYSGVLLAATGVGVARSHDGGGSWRQANGGLPTLAVRALAAAPGSEDTLLAGSAYFENLRVSTGSPDEYDGNLQLSTDGGRTWRVTSEGLQQITAVAFSPDFAMDEVAFAAAGTVGQHGYFDGGVYRSTNGGKNWQEILANLVISDVAVSPDFANDRTLWAAAWTYSGSNGVYRSTNGGDTWSPIAPGIAATELVVSPNFAFDQTLLAATAGGLQKSSNGGSSWIPVGPAEEVTAVAISPLYGASQTIVTATADALHRSTDGGASWQTLDIGLPATQAAEPLRLNHASYALDGSLLAAGYYGNLANSAFVLRSSDAGATWQAVGSGLTVDRVYELLTQPANSFLVTAAANSGLRQITVEQGTAAEPGVWSSSGPRGGRAMTLAVSPDFASDGVAFGGEWAANFQGGALGLGPFKSGDYGQTWQATPTEIPYSDPVLDYGLSPDFATDNTVFAATWGDVLKSTNGGQTWSGTGLMSGSLPGFIYRVAAAPDYASSGLVLAGSDYYGEALYASHDGGATWEDAQAIAAAGGIAFSPNFANDQTVFTAGGTGVSRSLDGAVSWTQVLSTVARSLAISPNFANDQTLFAGQANAPNTAVFYRSVNGGNSWISRAIAPGVKSINALAPSPAYAGDKTLFAGTDAGLYWSTNGGDNWTLIDAYAGQNVQSLAISPAWPGHAVLLVGLDEGVFRLLSADPATGIVRQATAHFSALSMNPLSLSGDLLLTAGPNHDVYASEDGGTSWESRGLGGGFYSFTEVAASQAYAADQTLFAARSRSGAIGGTLYRSQDGGGSWSGVLSSDLVSDLAISPGFASDQTLFAATNEKALQQSTDGGTTWQPAVSGLTASHYVLALAVSPAYATDQTLLALASWSNPPNYVLHYGVFTSGDGGLNWTQVGAGLPDEPLAGLMFSPHLATDNVAYVTTRAGELYRSRDRGSTWTLVGTAPGQPGFADVAVDEDGAVFVASDAGVWRYETSQFDIVINGGFETRDAWVLPDTPKPAHYSEIVVYDGRQAMQIGSAGGVNVPAYSSAWQDVTIPGGTKTAVLTFYTNAVSGDGKMAAEAAVLASNSPAESSETAAAAAGDAQYALIRDPGSDEVVQTLFWEQSNGQMWQSRTYDLSAYAGQTIRLHFGVLNDGSSGHTGLIVDNVSLLVGTGASGLYDVFLPVVRSP